jgi:hypothetical protein
LLGKEHPWSSLGDRLIQLGTWIERAPVWLRPAFFGVGLLVAFALARGALVVIPIIVVVLLFKNPSILVHRALPLLFYLVAAGFLGGLLYGVSGLFLRYLGRVGRLIQFILGTTVYFIFLVFFIGPVLDNTKPPPISSSEDWYFIGIMGVGIGLVLGLSMMFGNAKDTGSGSN